MKAAHFLSWMALVLLAAMAAQAQTDSGTSGPQVSTVGSPPPANPGRPTVTNPATLPPVGYLQFEQGFVQANGSPDVTHQFSVNQTTKLAMAPRLMLEFFSQPFASTEMASGHTRDTGDLDAGAQVVLHAGTGPLPTVAVGYIGRVRSGTAPDLDVGSFSQSALVLLSGDVGKFHYDINYVVSEQSDGRVRRAQFGQTLSVNHNIFTPSLSLAGELWRFSQPLVPVSSAQGARLGGNAVGTLWALAYSPRPNLVFDAGVDHGLTSTSTNWEGVAGFTYLFPKRLWKQR